MRHRPVAAAADAAGAATPSRCLTPPPALVVSTLRRVSPLVAAIAAAVVVAVWRTPRRDFIVVCRRPVLTTAADVASFSSEVYVYSFKFMTQESVIEVRKQTSTVKYFARKSAYCTNVCCMVGV